MPNISDKGVAIPVWLLIIIIGLLTTYAGSMYNQQANFNKEMIDAMYSIKQDMILSTRDKAYMLEKQKEQEAEIRERIKKDNEQDQRLYKLEKYH